MDTDYCERGEGPEASPRVPRGRGGGALISDSWQHPWPHNSAGSAYSLSRDDCIYALQGAKALRSYDSFEASYCTGSFVTILLSVIPFALTMVRCSWSDDSFDRFVRNRKLHAERFSVCCCQFVVVYLLSIIVPSSIIDGKRSDTNYCSAYEYVHVF